MDSPVPLMHHDPDRSWITDPDPDHLKGTHPKRCSIKLKDEKADIEVTGSRLKEEALGITLKYGGNRSRLVNSV